MALRGTMLDRSHSDTAVTDAGALGFAIIEEADGDSPNPAFRRHMMQALAANIPIGCLHICGADPEGEAKSFAMAFGPFKGKAVPFACGSVPDILDEFMRRSGDALGSKLVALYGLIRFSDGAFVFDGDADDWDGLARLG